MFVNEVLFKMYLLVMSVTDTCIQEDRKTKKKTRYYVCIQLFMFINLKKKILLTQVLKSKLKL